MRTTIDVADPILLSLKRLSKEEGKSLGQVASELLAQALAARKAKGKKKPPPFKWHTTPGRLLVDLDDKDAVWAILDADTIRKLREGR